MAKGGGVGTGAAYLQLEVPKDNTSQALQYWGGIKATENAADKLADEREANKKAELLEQYNVDPKDFDISNAGYTDYNDASRAFASEELARAVDLNFKAKQAFNKGNTQEADKLKGEADKITNSFKNLQATAETYKKNFEDYKKASEEGKVSGWSKGFGNFYRGALVEGKMKFGRNNNGEIVRMVQFKDEDGNLKTQMMTDRDAQSGNSRFYLKQDINKLTSDIAKDLGDTIEESVSGYYTTKNIQWGDKQGKAAKDLIDSQVNSPEVMADLVDQFNLYDEFDIDKANPPIKPNFTDEQKKIVADKLLETVKGKYNETMTQKFNSQKYSTDTTAATARSKGKSADDEAASQLKFDVTRAVNNGDYTILKRRFRPTKDSPEISVTDVVKSSDGQSLTLIMDDGEPVTIANSEPAITEFVLRNSPEYKNITPQKVISAEPLAYRGGSIQASDVGASIKEFFNEGGKLKKGQSKNLVQRIRSLGYEGQLETNILSPDEFTINGQVIKLGGASTLEDVSNQIKNAIKTKQVKSKSGNTYK